MYCIQAESGPSNGKGLVRGPDPCKEGGPVPDYGGSQRVWLGLSRARGPLQTVCLVGSAELQWLSCLQACNLSTLRFTTPKPLGLRNMIFHTWINSPGPWWSGKQLCKNAQQSSRMTLLVLHPKVNIGQHTRSKPNSDGLQPNIDGLQPAFPFHLELVCNPLFHFMYAMYAHMCLH